MLSITTDYASSCWSPEPYLRRIAEAGFTHVHWCHQWNTDFLYSRWEIEQIARWLGEFGLGVLDLHASHGMEKRWVSPRDYERLAGVELVANRLEMAARLGGEVIIMHAGATTDEDQAGWWDAVRASLDALAPIARACGVRIAIENGDFAEIRRLLAAYPPDFLGLCYDSGHGNMGRGLDELESLRDRLISIHLHDNDSHSDEHKIPFYGTVDWPRLARLLATSGYRKCVSSEAVMHRMTFTDEAAFLAEAHAQCSKLAVMVREARE